MTNPDYKYSPQDIVERLRNRTGTDEIDWLLDEAGAEIERLRMDKAAISKTASDYLHELGRLREALEPFGRKVSAPSLSEALGHISRDDLLRAKELRSEHSKEQKE